MISGNRIEISKYQIQNKKRKTHIEEIKVGEINALKK
jgi:hypothetical protein